MFNNAIRKLKTFQKGFYLFKYQVTFHSFPSQLLQWPNATLFVQLLSRQLSCLCAVPHSRSSKKKKDGCLFISLTVIVWVAESH